MTSFLSTLVPAAVVAIILLGVFLLLRPKLRRLYAPRTYIEVLDER